MARLDSNAHWQRGIWSWSYAVRCHTLLQSEIRRCIGQIRLARLDFHAHWQRRLQSSNAGASNGQYFQPTRQRSRSANAHGQGNFSVALHARHSAIEDPWSLAMVSLLIAISSPIQSKPNKALEPTSTSVTLRAIVSSSEMKRWTAVPIPARSAPAVAVAHL